MIEYFYGIFFFFFNITQLLQVEDLNPGSPCKGLSYKALGDS